MLELNNKELMNIEGGATWSASLFNAAARTIETVLDIGRSLGSALRRIFNGKYCSI